MSTVGVVTGRNEVVAKVIFLHLSVIHSVHRGGLPQCMPGCHPPWDYVPPPDYVPPGLRTPQTMYPLDYVPPGLRTPWTTYPPRLHTPPDYVPPLQTMYPPSGLHTPAPRTMYPPGADPPGRRLQHTVYERPVRILLECILVCDWIYFRKKFRSLCAKICIILHEKIQFFWSGGILGEVRNGLRERAIRVILAMLAFSYCLIFLKKG